jgi:hypothetical protein
MSTKNYGGPAFPVELDNSNGQEPTTGFYGSEDLPPGMVAAYPGLSTRDYFAAKAMQGMLACQFQPQSGPDMLARDAYTVADAMIAERDK